MSVTAFRKILADPSKLKSFCDEIPLSVLEAGLARLVEIVEARKVAEEDKIKKISAYLEQLKKDGIDPTELIPDDLLVPRGTRAKRPAKYCYKGSDGTTKYWTGQGRTPLPIQEAINRGGSMDDFLIAADDQKDPIAQ